MQPRLFLRFLQIFFLNETKQPGILESLGTAGKFRKKVYFSLVRYIITKLDEMKYFNSTSSVQIKRKKKKGRIY